MLTFLSNQISITKKDLYFSVIVILVAVYSTSITFIASYYLGYETIHHFAAYLVCTSSFLLIFFLTKRYIHSILWLTTSILSLLIICCSSLHFFFYIRPFTLYYSVLIFTFLYIWAGLGGLLCAQIQLLNSKKPTRISIIQIFAVILIFIILFLDLKPIQRALTPLITSFGMLLIFALALIEFNKRLTLIIIPTILFFLLLGMYPFLPEFRFFENQKDFEDKVIFNSKSEKFDITITQWMDHYWLYLNKIKNISSIDEFLFYEPFAHSAAFINPPKNVLILGGENGCLSRELLKYDIIQNIDLVPYDFELLSVCMNDRIMKKINQNSLSNPKITIKNFPVLNFITQHNEMYDIIFIDLPDPRNLELNQFYTIEFYKFISDNLNDGGLFITQAGSPYFATKAFLTIENTIQSAGFNTLPIHNQIITLGEWGWVIGSKSLNTNTIKNLLSQADFSSLNTRWLNNEAIQLITSFGKNYISINSMENNTQENPVVYKYFLEGNWAFD